MPLKRNAPPSEAVRFVLSTRAGATVVHSSRKYVARLYTRSGRLRLTKPRFVGWQHIIHTDHGVARVTTRQREGRHELGSISTGPFAEAAARAIQTLQNSGPELTVSSLTIPTLLLQALWLRSAAGDRYFILDPSPRMTVRNRPLTAAQFLRSLAAVRALMTSS